jgi:lipopolysaccharide transport system permease protein
MLRPLSQLLHYREAIRMLVVRDLRVRYSNSALGILWSLLNPLLMMLVFTLVFTFFMPSQIEKYPLYILTGLLPWNFFTASLVGSVVSILQNGPLVSRVYFPREILPLSVVIANLINFLLALILLLVIMLASGVWPGASLLLLPGIILIQVLFTLGLGLFLAALNVQLRDTQAMVDVLTLAWFFVTPIIYPLNVIRNPSLQLLLQVLNPMASLVVSYRTILYAGQMPDFGIILITFIEVALLLVLGYWFFHRASPAFAEEL